MKNSKYLIFLITVMLLFSSCEDFLKEEPKDEFSSELFFQSSAQAYNAVNYLYHLGATDFYDTWSAYSGRKQCY
jgi:hypothetical protein